MELHLIAREGLMIICCEVQGLSGPSVGTVTHIPFSAYEVPPSWHNELATNLRF